MRAAIAIAALVAGLAGPAGAETIRNPVALFAGLDKITGTITRFEAGIDEVEDLLRPVLCDARGNWTADYVRLRVEAARP